MDVTNTFIERAGGTINFFIGSFCKLEVKGTSLPIKAVRLGVDETLL
jgi:hypothetical protein